MSEDKLIKVKRRLQGTVVSNKMHKTISVEIKRRVEHPKYHKYVMRRTKLLVHDEDNVCLPGDEVLIQESRPLSRRKNWVLVKVIRSNESLEKANDTDAVRA
jgi:small subunit ribosomal protein S17